MERQLFERVISSRESQRVFTGDATDEQINYILQCLEKVPNSCNRMGTYQKVVTERDEKAMLGGLLVGGVGWCHRASHIILLFADMEAYKSPAERDNMPYLDAGAKLMMGYLAAEIQGLGCCYINPNVREENKDIFSQRFGADRFCGALAIGKYNYDV